MFSEEDINNISSDLLDLVLLLTSRIFNPTQMSKGVPIPHSHMKVIFHLVMSGTCPVSKIANDLIISKPNMTPIIDNLISEGYVNRYDDPNDRRVTMIEATEKAQLFLKEHRERLKNLLTEKISVLGHDDLETLKSLIIPMTNVISKID
ncbi:MAG TPA: MarR family winged helix-turn-helix transcriptional regulator [Ruminiclostridium sp.]